MKRDNKLVKFTTFVLLITILAIVLVSGTYAKYTSQVSGESTATVAKWSIKVNGSELAVAQPTITFNLFETIKDTDGATEDDVTESLIAPGTSGSFNLTVKNESEVTAKYAISFEVSESDIPLQFSIDGGQTWTDKTITNPTEKTLAIGAAEETLTVQWKWPYEVVDDANVVDTTVDTADTELGIEAQTAPAQVTVTTTLTATQVD